MGFCQNLKICSILYALKRKDQLETGQKYLETTYLTKNRHLEERTKNSQNLTVEQSKTKAK